MNFKEKDFSEDFPSEGKIYLNNASVSLMPYQSIKSMSNFLTDYSKMGPDSLESEKFIEENFIRIRKTISKLVHCKPEEIVLNQSTTEGVNYVANGLSLNSESNIIIRGMDHEHHANFFPWLRLSDKIKLKSMKIVENGFFKFPELEENIDENTKLVALSHALYNTGAILPVEEVGKYLKEKNIPFFLDAAQTVGCIGDYNFEKTNCNFMSFNGSKWLCGPMGIGVFYCKRDSSQLLEPLMIGGESAMIYDKTKLAYKEIPDKFQTGFRNYAGMIGLENSILYLQKFGLDNIRKKVRQLANSFCEEIKKMKNVTLYRSENENCSTSIVSFSLQNKEPHYIVEKLEKKGIILAVREIYDKKIVRLSPHFFNSQEQIQKTVEEIKKL